MAKKITPKFVDGIVDLHFINPRVNKIAEDNIVMYEDLIYEAINYINNNKISEVWLWKDNFFLDECSDSDYKKYIKEILDKLNKLVTKIETVSIH